MRRRWATSRATSDRRDLISALPRAGVLTYISEPQLAGELTRYTRTGALTPLDARGTWANPRLSDDDARVVANHGGGRGPHPDLEVFDIVRGAGRLLVSGELVIAGAPKWTAGSTAVQFTRLRSDGVDWVQKPVDGSAESILAQIPFPGLNVSGTLQSGGVYGFALRNGNRDLLYLPTLTTEPRPLFATPANETQPALSPNERWIAYATDVEGGDQHRDIAVDLFPAGGQRILVSGSLGGVQPVWRRDGRELFYLSNDQRLMSVSIDSSGNQLRVGQPVAPFRTSMVIDGGLGTRSSYDASRDGDRHGVDELAVQIVRKQVRPIAGKRVAAPNSRLSVESDVTRLAQSSRTNERRELCAQHGH
jgi:hypothetical protein